MTANENERTKNERDERSVAIKVNPSELQNAPRWVSVRTVRLSDRYFCDLVLRGLNYRR
jgi:hypothetical protein